MGVLSNILGNEIGGLINASYERHTGRWVVWDNDISTAEELKRMHPHDPVYLYNPDTKIYKRYTIEIKDRKLTMRNGRFIHEEETIEV